MFRSLKIAGWLGFAVVLLFGALFVTFYWLIQIGEFREYLVSEVERQTQLKVRVGEARLRIGRAMGISFRDFALLAPDKDQPILEAQRVLVRVALLPLLQRQLVFDEIRLYEPKLQIARDEEGKISVLEMILSLPFTRRHDMRFDLALREIKMEKGEILFLDYRRGERAVLTRLRDVSLDLQRVQTRDALPPPHLRSERPPEQDRAIQFSLKTTIEKDNQKGELSSKGKVILPTDGLEFRKAWLDADIQMVAMSAALFHEYYARLLSVKAVQGVLNSYLRWQGSLDQGGQIKAEIGFQRLEVEAPDFFLGRLLPGNGRLELAADWSPETLRISRFDLRSQEVSMVAQGSLRSLGEKGSALELHLATPYLAVVTARKYIPWRVLGSPAWGSLVGAVNQGEIKLTSVALSGPLSDIRRPLKTGLESHLALDAEVRGLSGDLGQHYLPLRGVSGRIVLQKGVLYYKGFKGAYGQSRLAEVEASQKGVLPGQGLLELQAKGEMDLGEMREQSKRGFLPSPAAKVLNGLDELGGTAKFGISLRNNSGSYDYKGQLALENASMRTGDFSFAQMKGEVSFSPTEIHAEKLTALLGGSPIQARAALRDYLSERSAFDLTVESSGVRAGLVTRMLFSTGSLQDPGMVRGTVRYQGPFNSPEERRLSGALELVGIQIPLRLFSQPLRDIVGKVNFDGRGFDFQNLRGQVLGYGFTFSGQWRYAERPQLVFTFSSPEIDLGRALSHQNLDLDEWYDRLQARGKIAIGKGRHEGFEFSDLRTDLSLDKRVWRFENLSAASAGGTVQGTLSFIDSRDRLGISVEPIIRGVPVQTVLRWFDFDTREIRGVMDATGKFESGGSTRAERRRNLNGDFHLEMRDGALGRLPLLVRILNLIDLTRWFSFQVPDFRQRGISFHSVTGDFKVKQGTFATENLVVDSDDISITGAGQYDGPTDYMEAVVALRPFPRIRAVVSYIPLIGPGIAAIKDSVMVVSFHVQGSMENPTVTPAPLSTLSEFFFGALRIPQSLITIPGTGNK
jgi:uncharacterized protein YhdP